MSNMIFASVVAIYHLKKGEAGSSRLLAWRFSGGALYTSAPVSFLRGRALKVCCFFTLGEAKCFLKIQSYKKWGGI